MRSQRRHQRLFDILDLHADKVIRGLVRVTHVSFRFVSPYTWYRAPRVLHLTRVCVLLFAKRIILLLISVFVVHTLFKRGTMKSKERMPLNKSSGSTFLTVRTLMLQHDVCFVVFFVLFSLHTFLSSDATSANPNISTNSNASLTFRNAPF